MNTKIEIKNAEYVEGYIIKFVFNDGQEQLVDFESYLKTQNHPQFKRFWDTNHFKNFRIDNADAVVWGKHWDLCFDVSNLYNNDLTNYFDNYEREKDKIIVL
jgi:hypothetical protein